MQSFDRFPLIATAAVATALLASPPPPAVAGMQPQPDSFGTVSAGAAPTCAGSADPDRPSPSPSSTRSS
jgi:hypothetical protein